jgi:hypothetical protein
MAATKGGERKPGMTLEDFLSNARVIHHGKEVIAPVQVLANCLIIPTSSCGMINGNLRC